MRILKSLGKVAVYLGVPITLLVLCSEIEKYLWNLPCLTNIHWLFSNLPAMCVLNVIAAFIWCFATEALFVREKSLWLAILLAPFHAFGALLFWAVPNVALRLAVVEACYCHWTLHLEYGKKCFDGGTNFAFTILYGFVLIVYFISYLAFIWLAQLLFDRLRAAKLVKPSEHNV